MPRWRSSPNHADSWIKGALGHVTGLYDGVAIVFNEARVPVVGGTVDAESPTPGNSSA